MKTTPTQIQAAEKKRASEYRKILSNLAEISDADISRLLAETEAMKRSAYAIRKAEGYADHYRKMIGVPISGILKPKRPRIPKLSESKPVDPKPLVVDHTMEGLREFYEQMMSEAGKVENNK